MNTLPLALLATTGIYCGVTAVLLILLIIFLGNRFHQAKQDEFIEKIKNEFPGCKVTGRDDSDEIRILYEGQPLIVTEDSDGSLHSEPYEPDANEALAP